ncbi:MAG TPA: RluA family pseudouridine synthase [Pyrinomonadaceae bacterium]|nr:RluA family pseudouridine synthase [Pyrinomonadaceae bacterium]
MSDENTSLNFQTQTEDIGKRLDVFLSEKIEGWSRSRLQRLIAEGEVLVNQKQAKSSYKLNEDDEIEVELAELPATVFEPENIPLDIVFEDEFLAVINKPAGMIIHPGAGIPSGTLANAIAWHFKFQIPNSKLEDKEIPNPKSQIPNRLGVVHRLDKDTSGLIVVAKDERTSESLSGQFQSRKVYNSYVALVHGMVERNSGKIEAPIARDKFNRLKMSVQKDGRSALSLWKARQRFEKFTLLDVEIKTGRTHQIRVHLAYINHPIVGDKIYNEGRDNTVNNDDVRRAIQNLNRFFLHAEKLGFTHPATKEKMNFTAPMPDELTEFLELI